jgi:dynein heavy chain 1
MFRIFSKFNALFVRPRIKGAIQEYQIKLVQKVKQGEKKFSFLKIFFYQI